MKSPEDSVAVAAPGDFTKDSVAVAVPGGVAVPVPGVAALTMHMDQQSKQGGKCCGSCCDYRRAVIILSSISILFTVISLGRGPQEVNVEDDDLAKDIVAIQDEYVTGALIMSIFSLILALVSLVGAVRFNQHMVSLNVLYVFINFVLSVVFGSKATNEILDLLNESDYGAEDDAFAPTEEDQEAVERIVKYGVIVTYVLLGAITAFWIYPSVMLITEIRSGIMSRETYRREEFSCCCVSK